MYDLNLLQPAEKDQLLNELLSKYENEVSTQRLGQAKMAPGAEMPHEDVQADMAMLEPFAQVLDILIDKVEELEERIEANEKLVIDDLFGGIDRMYKQNLRSQSIEGLKGKYGSLFEPHMSALSELAPGEDIYDTLHDLLEEAKGQGDWSDEREFESVKNAAQAIGDKIAKIKGQPVAVEVQKTEVQPAQEGAESKFLEKVKQMRAKAPKNM